MSQVKDISRLSFAALVALLLVALPAHAEKAAKPHIVVIWGDDIGQSDLSAYTFGLMGFETPNIDRVAKEGMLFTDYYAEQSCTAGRSAFITGQSVFRTGLSKVGLPGAKEGMQAADPDHRRAAQAPRLFATGQFGKNHLGDRDEFLPTNHGFDEFYGNLYHLNAEEEPEHEDYPGPGVPQEVRPARRDPQLLGRRAGKLGHRGHRSADAQAHGDHRRRRGGASGREVHRERRSSGQARLPVGQLHPHALPHPHQARERGQAGRWQSNYHDTMIDHDRNVGTVLDKLDELGIADEDDRDLRHRQRAPHEHLARRGHDALPKREELELGGRVPRARAGPLARPDQGRLGLQRDRLAPRLDADVARRRRRCRTSRNGC